MSSQVSPGPGRAGGEQPPAPDADTAAAQARPEAAEPSGCGRLRTGLLPRIIAAYKSPVVRTYCRIRFLIIRQTFLDEVGQYLPEEGQVLDVGCGFGLFGLYFAGGAPRRRLVGYDLNVRRIGMARLAARRLGIHNARFNCGDAVTLSLRKGYDAIYALDLIHHLPREAVPGFLRGLYQCLRPGGVMIIKDVERRPAYKRWFTLALDRVMVGWREPIHYWEKEELLATLRRLGFQVCTHRMLDILPYPHILYVCRKPPDPRPIDDLESAGS